MLAHLDGGQILELVFRHREHDAQIITRILLHDIQRRKVDGHRLGPKAGEPADIDHDGINLAIARQNDVVDLSNVQRQSGTLSKNPLRLGMFRIS